MTAATKRRDETIQIRANAEAKALIQRAAALRGQKLSEFVLDSARRQAEETILDQRLFILNDEQHEEFLRLLDNPHPLDPAAKARLTRKPPREA